MTTFVLLTITGLGLGAMYFLIASGLSLIYGLMGVLNFAHGAFITVGSYATWWMSDERLRRRRLGRWLRFLAQRALRARRRRGLRRARRARPDPAALPAPHRAGARDGRALDRVRRARPGHLGTGRRRPYAVPAWLHETTTILGAHIPNDRCRRDRAPPAVVARAARAVPAPDALRADHPRGRREPRDGDRARHRRAQGVHARVRARRRRRRARRRALGGVYFSDDRPDQGTSLLIFAFIVVVIGGLGSIAGSAIAAVVVGLRPAVRELLRVADRRASATSRSSSCSRSCCSCARAGSPGGVRVNRRVAGDFVWPLAVFGALAFVPKIGLDIPKLFDGAISSPGTLQLLALCLLFGGLALTYDLLFGFTGLLSFGHALYVAVGVYMTNIAITRVALELRAGAPVHGRARLRRAARARRRLASCRRDRVRDGHARVRAGGCGARAQGPARLDARRGGARHRLHEAARLLRRHLQHEVPLLARARLPRRRVLHRALGGRVVAGARVAGDSRERAARRGARAAARARTS